MSLFNFLNKKKAPDELPSLAIDDLKKPKSSYPSLSQTSPQIPKVEKVEEKKDEDRKVEIIKKEDYIKEKKPEPKIEIKTNPVIQENLSSTDKPEDEKSFFNQLLLDINGEINDLNKLEEWYNNKFMPQDVISQMREYWEDQKHELVIKSIGQDFKEKVSLKIAKMQELEKQWQDLYLDVVKKEEEMKREEKELKAILAEFVEMCKRRGRH